LEGFEVALRQYQADGATGLAFGGTAFEESVVLSADVVLVPDSSRSVDQVVFVVSKDAEKPREREAGKDQETEKEKPKDAAKVVSKFLRFAGRNIQYRLTFDKLDEGDYHWTVKLIGTEKDAQGGKKDAEWTFPAGRTEFGVQRGITEPIALALAGPYLFAFEVVSVLLLAALVGAAFLARKEVREA
jgi:hypothetical protein